MSSPVHFPQGFDQKGIKTCIKGDKTYNAYWAKEGQAKLHCWIAIASAENESVAMEYRNDPQKFQSEGGGAGLREDVFIKFQNDLKKQSGLVEKGIAAAMNLEMTRRLLRRHNVGKYKPSEGVTQDIEDNVDHLIEALKARLLLFIDDVNFDGQKGELFLEDLKVVVDGMYGCVSGNGETEAWKQQALRDSLKLNPGYTLGTISIGSKSPFSNSMEKGYAASRKRVSTELESCGLILTSQQPKKGQLFFEVGESKGKFYVQPSTKAGKKTRSTAVETLVRMGLAAKKSATKFELAVKLMEATNDILREEARRIRESGEECPPHLNGVIQQIDSLTGQIRSFDNSRSLDNSGIHRQHAEHSTNQNSHAPPAPPAAAANNRTLPSVPANHVFNLHQQAGQSFPPTNHTAANYYHPHMFFEGGLVRGNGINEYSRHYEQIGHNDVPTGHLPGMQWAGAGANQEQGVAGTATHNLHPQSDIPGTGAAPRISPEATALPQMADVRFQSQDQRFQNDSEAIANRAVEDFCSQAQEISTAGSDSSDDSLDAIGNSQGATAELHPQDGENTNTSPGTDTVLAPTGEVHPPEDSENTNISSDTGTVLAAGASFDDQEDEDDSANLRRQSDIPGTTEVHPPQDGENTIISPTDKEDEDVEDGSAEEASSVGNELVAEYQLVAIVDQKKENHDCFKCGDVAQSEWDLVDGPPHVDGLTKWYYCPECQLCDFLTDPETGKPLVPGEWPLIDEVAADCIVEEVGHYYRTENGEDKLICYVCHEENEEKRPKKRARNARNDGSRRSASARPNEWKKRDDLRYLTKEWYAKYPNHQRCSQCNLYLRPKEMKLPVVV